MVSNLKVYNEISRINDFLFLSGAAPLRTDVIRQKKITCIVNSTVDEPGIYVPGIDHVKIRIDDSPYARIDAYFDMVADRIKSVRDGGGRILVHCVAGVSRSASLCLAYFVRHERISLRDAYFRVRSCRPIIRPNNGFWRQLIDYEKKCLGRPSIKMVPSNTGEDIPDIYSDQIPKSSTFSNGLSGLSLLRARNSSPLTYGNSTDSNGGRSDDVIGSGRSPVSRTLSYQTFRDRYASSSLSPKKSSTLFGNGPSRPLVNFSLFPRN